MHTFRKYLEISCLEIEVYTFVTFVEIILQSGSKLGV